MQLFNIVIVLLSIFRELISSWCTKEFLSEVGFLEKNMSMIMGQETETIIKWKNNY